MDHILFGDNQFFGINHMSEEKARAQTVRFQDIGAVIEVLDHAYAEGIRTFMCTTHERIAEVCDHFRENAPRYPDFQFYPCMPYAHKYANAATEVGLLEAIRQFLPEEGRVKALLKGSISFARKDIEGMAQLLIDAEMKIFHSLRTPVIFLQNVVTDLLLGMGMHDVLRIFADHIRIRYDAEPGFITMNLPLLLDALEKAGIDNPIVCANINKLGFRMSGGRARYESLLASRRFRPVAMSVFASGALPAYEALDYVCRQNVHAIVFGASSRHNIRQTRQLYEDLLRSHSTARLAAAAHPHMDYSTGEETQS
jgi:hypothetical protein